MKETVGPDGRSQRAGGWWKAGIGTSCLKITPESQPKTAFGRSRSWRASPLTEERMSVRGKWVV